MSNRMMVAILLALVMLMTVILAPLSLLAGRLVSSGAVGANGVSGSVWGGLVRGVTVAGSRIGDVKVGLSPLALVTGQIQVDARRDPITAGRTTILLGKREYGVKALNLRAPIDLTEAGLPLAGVVVFTDVAGVFEQGRCVSARGRIQIRLAGEGPLQGAVLSGAPVCRGGSLIATLISDGGDGKATLIARIDGEGRFQLELAVATTDQAEVQALLTSGFSKDATGARRTAEGRLFPSEKAVAK